MAFGLGLVALIKGVEDAYNALAAADPAVASAVHNYFGSLKPVADAVVAPTVDVSLAPGTNLTVN
jgi:hypothetical protein